ncbi:MAG: methyltransferase [Firmicutes bacterium]|nr:methyltransferase [Bacillota bacterium]
MEEFFLNENERLDDLQINNLYVIQDKTKYCFTSDAVVLSNFAKVKRNEIVYDFGCGCGVISILLYAKYSPKKIYGIEIDSDLYNLAVKSARYNKLEDKVKIINCDILNAHKQNLEKAQVIVCNPPYFKTKDFAFKNENPNKAFARHDVNLNDLFKAVTKNLDFGKRFYIIFPSDRTAELIETLLKYNLQPKTMQLVQAKHKPPHLVLIESVLGGKSGLKVLNNLVL